MPSDAEKLLGAIALKLNYIDQKTLDAAVKVQETAPSKPLGEILMERKVINQKQLDHLLKLQSDRMQSVDPRLKKRKESVLFGKLVVTQKLATLEQVNECLRLQAQDRGTGRTLGEVMVEKGYIKPEDVRRVLGSQKKKTMRCEVCNLNYTVMTTTGSTKVKCPKCKGLLIEQKKGESIKPDAEFGTMIARAVDLQLAPPKVARAASSTNMMRTRCVICDNEFVGTLDSTGRIRCPKCHSIFTPRKK